MWCWTESLIDGVFGESCGITAGYLPESVVCVSYMPLIAVITDYTSLGSPRSLYVGYSTSV